MKYILTGIIPSKKNNRKARKQGKRIFTVPSDAYERWHEISTLELKEQGIKKHENICSVQIYFWFPDNRRKDLSNACESVMDLLVDNGIIKDDCWQEIPTLYLSHVEIDKNNPRAEIIINTNSS